MSTASHAYSRLRELYGYVLNRTRERNARLFQGHRAPAGLPTFEQLEPRLLLDATPLFSDDFATTTIDPLNWTAISEATIDDVGIGEPSLDYSLRLNGNPSGGDSVSSKVIDLSGFADGTLSYYYEQTGGGETADPGEDLIISYWDGAGWVELERQLGSGPDMTSYVQSSIALPGAAMHSGFRFQISNIATAGPYDDWFVDDVELTASSTLTVNLPTDATEGDGIVQGTVVVDEAVVADLAVDLLSDDTSEATVPASVTILAGQISATFDVTIVNDSDLDGTQTVTISASAAGYGAGGDTIAVHDNEAGVLTVALPANATEGDGTLVDAGTVTVDQAPTNDVVVELSSDDTSEATVPATVTILSGQTSATFDITVVEDTEIDDTQIATITAHVENWTDGSDTIDVLDNEPRDLIVTLPADAWESDGTVADAGTVSISGTLGSDLVVSLSSNDTTELDVPVTATILAGATSATFDLLVQDDGEYDGVQTAMVTAGAAGFTDGSDTMDIRDDEVDHFAFATVSSPQGLDNPFPVTISAEDINDQSILVYAGTVGLTGSGDGGAAPIDPIEIVLAAGVWTGDVTVQTVDTNVVLTADDGLGHVGTSNPFDVLTSEIHGRKWHDVNGDGIWDAGEPVLEGWTIYLDLDEDGEFDAGVEPFDVTNAAGEYSFIDLVPGTYIVAEVLQSGWEQSYPGGGGGGDDTTVADVVSQVDIVSYTSIHQGLLYTYLGDNRGAMGGVDHDPARDNILTYFQGLGLDASLDPFVHGGYVGENVVGIHLSSVNPNDIYIVGAHYDSANNPGADDNGSGTAGVMEAARVLSQYDFDSTLIFIAFDQEEQGLHGSYAYVDEHVGDNILGMLNLDMIAYNPAGPTEDMVRLYDVVVGGSIKSDLISAFNLYGGGVLAVDSAQNSQSDHAPFEVAGFDAALAIEYEVWSNPNYHTANDAVETPSYIDYGFATNVTAASVGYLATAAGVLGLTASVGDQAPSGAGQESFGAFYSPPQSHLFELGGFLSEPSADAPLDIAVDYLTSYAANLGLAASDLDNFVVTDLYVSEHTGVTHIYLGQTYGGLEVLGANINVNITADGQVINVGSSFVSGLGGWQSKFDLQPMLSASEALASLAADFGWTLGAAPVVISSATELGQPTLLAASGVSSEYIPGGLFYVPTADGGVELAWNLLVETLDGEHVYDAGVSTSDGDVLYWSDWVSADTYNVYEQPIESPNHGSRTLVVNPADAVASAYGWHDTDGVAGAEYTVTRGNNVHAYADRNDDNAADAGGSPDGGAGLVFDFAIDLGQQPISYQDAAVTNLFYWNNVIHDIYYQYGFDEVSGNFQVNNYGAGGLGGDDVMAEAQDGADVGNRNNANFYTPPDGSRPRMQMYVWDLTTPMRDGDLDNGIIIHEYTHGLSNRLTGGPGNASALNANQSRSMGEGWSDWYGLMLTQLATDAALAGRGIGTYALGQPITGVGIRTYRYSYDMAINPYTYGDISGLTVPHGAGEVWAATIWDLNWALIDGNSLDANLPNSGLGFDPDLYNGTGGNNLAMQLVTDGMKLQPALPTYLDARDAILLADMALTGGANQMTIWTVFARRGMGFSADDGGSAGNMNVTEAFDLPASSQGTVLFDEITYEIGELVTITVRDSDLTGGGPIAVSVVSTGGDSETVTLAEIGAGVFEGSILTASGNAVPANGTLEVFAGNVITVTYNDADDGTGNPAVLTDTADIITFTDILAQDFESGLAPNETVSGAFAINNTNGPLNNGTFMMGHAGTYGNNEYSYYELTVDLTDFTNVQLQFDYTAQIESYFDGFNVQASIGPISPPSNLIMPTSGLPYTSAMGLPQIGTLAYDGGGALDSGTAVFDLSAFDGQVVNIRFQFGSDGSVTYPGINIDNVVVRAAGSPGVPGTHTVVVGPGEIITGINFGNHEGIDFGDAPDPTYPTLLASNGARHVLGSGLFLGAGVDTELDGQPDPNALGDDNDGNDDEDGVVFNTPLIPGNIVSLTVTASALGFLNAWIDFNADGDWADPGEQFITDVALIPGPNVLNVPVPGTATPGVTFARFRFSSIAGLSYDGLASDGEVEDYQVVLGEDFGDAPDPTYPTLLASNGARHALGSGLFLGAGVDAEPDGQPGPNALGDDNDGNDDEDGVVFTSALVGGQTATVDVTASGSGLLNAWIDFNADGDWADPGEQIFTDVALVAGVNSLSFAVVATPPDRTYARFRFSSIGGLSFDGAAPDGEVEDYAFGKIDGSKWHDLNGDGVWDAGEPGMQGWTMYVDSNNNGQLDPGEPSDITDGAGDYSITGLAEGTYTVAEVLQGAWMQTFPGGGGGAGDTVYVRSTVGQPWGSSSNEAAMDLVFGAGAWQDLRYETLNPATLFSPNTSFIYMEGSDNNASELEAFLTANIGLIETWGMGGGSLFLNAAPNEGDGMSFGFGGVTLTYPDSSTNPVTAVDPLHPIFIGPYTPITTSYTGSSFAHATIGGPGLTSLMTDAGAGVALAEKVFGAGHVAFGGLTTDNFHLPQPDGANLRANIIAYVYAQAIGGPGTHTVVLAAGQIVTGIDFGNHEGIDFGDAPDPTYPTLLASDGARHALGSGLFLGAGVDTELNGQPDPNAQGDDNDGNDDEDGVVFNTPLIPGNIVSLTVTASAPGLLNAWIDFNADGDWADPGEQFITDVALVAGPNVLNVPVPGTATPGVTFVRFRFSSLGGLSFDGAAPDGEVEDYQVVLGADFGDAPDPTYPTLLASNGARHALGSGLFLGAGVDAEPDGQPDPNALGDDNDGNDDEDGVVFTSALVGGQTATVDVTASGSGLLNAWIDFNADGDWADPGEQIFTDVALVAGVNSLNFAVPVTPPDRTYARFRFSSLGGLSFDGPAPDGEVEDYAFGKIDGSKWHDLNGDGVWDAGEPGVQGWTMYVDSNHNGQLDPGEPSDITDGAGDYSITGLAEGTYTVAEVLQVTWVQTFPGGAALESLSAVDIFTQDFEAGLGPNETTSGAFTINNTNGPLNNGTMMMGHAGTYGNSEYSYYELTVDLTGFIDVQLQFDYAALIENHFDRVNVQASTGPISPPNDLIVPTSGLPYEDQGDVHRAELGQIAYDSGGVLDSGIAVFDLSAFDGQVVNIRFQFGSDGSVTYSGINIDNLVVWAAGSSSIPGTHTVVVGPGEIVTDINFGNLHVEIDVVVDNASATLTGEWMAGTYRPGYYATDYLHDQNIGKGIKSVTFTPMLTQDGQYEVYLWWPVWSGAATNVPVDVAYDGGTMTVSVDQSINGGQWNLIGSYDFTAWTGSATIRTDGTTSHVVADAVRFLYVGNIAGLTVTVDPLTTVDTTPELTGMVNYSAAAVQVTVDGNTYSATNNGDGTWTLADDTISPALAMGTYDVLVAADMGGGPVNDGTTDELEIVVAVTDVIVDNVSATVTGDWLVATFRPNYYGTDYLQDQNTGKGAKSVKFTPTLMQDGQYEVYLWWPEADMWATNVPVDVTHDGGTSTIIVDETTKAGQWNLIGTYSFTAGTGSATIRTDGTTSHVVADAARFLRVANLPLSEVIVDETEGIPDGSWMFSAFRPNYYGSWYAHDGNAGKGLKSYTFTPDLEGANDYEVYMWWPVWSTAATNVPVYITHAAGTSLVTANQSVNGGQWNLLGTYSFDAGTAGNVRIETAGTTSHVIADAVRFAPVLPVPLAVTVDPLTTADTTPELTGTVSDPVATVQVTVDGNTYAAVNNGDGTWTLADDTISPALAMGTYDVLVAADIGGAPVNDGTTDELEIVVPATDVIVDNASATVIGDWLAGTYRPDYYGGNYLHDKNSGKGGKSVTFTPTAMQTGRYDVYLWWPDASIWATNVPVDVMHDGGTSTVSVDESIDGGQWNLIGTYDFTAGTGSVTIRTDGTVTHVAADAVRFLRIAEGTVIVDNASATMIGDWQATAFRPNYYDTNYLHDKNADKGSNSVTFTPTLPQDGQYEVYLWWPDASIWAANVPVDVMHVGGTSTVSVDESTNGGQWNLIGTYDFMAGTGSVIIRTGGTTSHVAADAVRFVRVGDIGGLIVTIDPLTTTDTTPELTGMVNDPAATVQVTVDGNTYLATNNGDGTWTLADDAIIPPLALGTYDVVVEADIGGAPVSDGTTNELEIVAPVVDVIVDNTSATVTGDWMTSSYRPDYYGGDYLHDRNSDKGAKTITFTPTLPQDGQYEVYVWWPDAPLWATNVPVDVTHDGGKSTVIVVESTNGGQWNLIGTYNFTAGTGSVIIRTDGTTSHVAADAVRFLRIGDILPVSDVIVDNASAAVTGDWLPGTYRPKPHGLNYLRHRNSDKDSKSVTFTPTMTQDGQYEVYLRWLHSPILATNVLVDVVHDGGTSTVSVDEPTNGGQWNLIGTYDFTAGTGSVTIRTDGTTLHVAADAVRFVRVGDI